MAAVSTAPPSRSAATSSGPSACSPWGSGARRRDTGVSGSSGVGERLEPETGGIDQPQAGVVEHGQHVERRGVLDQAAGVVPVDRAHDDTAVRRPVDVAGQQVRPDQRTGHQRPPELLEREHRVGPTQPGAAVGLGQSEREQAEVGQLAPALPVDATASARPRTTAIGNRPVQKLRTPSASAAWSSLSSKSTSATPSEGRGCARR